LWEKKREKQTQDCFLSEKEKTYVLFTSGFGSQSNEQIESSTLEIVNAGDHCDRSISRQMAPFELIFG